MDPTRFDAITRALGQAHSRRGVLAALGAAGFGLLSRSAPAAAIPSAPFPVTFVPCPPSVCQFNIFELTIDKIDPEFPIEGKPVAIYFTLTVGKNNQRDAHGWVESYGIPGRADHVFVQRGHSRQGIISTTAPRAGIYPQVNVVFYDSNDPNVGETNHPEPSAGSDYFEARISGLYTFSVDQFVIKDTRSPHEDTDFASFEMSVDGVQVVSNANHRGLELLTEDKGNVNNGTYKTPTLHFDNVLVPINSDVRLTYQVINHGNAGTAGDWINKNIDAFTGAIAEILSNFYPGTSWTAVAKLVDKLTGSAFGNCDGVCAWDAFLWHGYDLASATFNGPYSETHPYPYSTMPIEMSDWYNTADGCNGKSHYTVTWSVRHSS